jgi:DNA-binding LacI/PurR family transcriptional regulator
VDDGSGAEAAAAHLIGLGHRRLGLICFELAPDRRGGPVDAARRAGARFAVTRARLDGYAHGLAGAADVEVTIEETAHNSQGDGQAAALALLRRDERPTGLLAMSDELALGALAAAAECGLSVPGDVSVVGFDDTPAAGRATPALTTVAQPLRPKGELAGDALLALLDGRPVQPAALPTRLVVRASTGPPPGPRNAAVTWERVRPPARSARRRSG